MQTVPFLVSAGVTANLLIGGTGELDKLLGPIVRDLRLSYIQGTPPALISDEAESILGSDLITDHDWRGSVQLARLYHLAAETLLARGGGVADIKKAEGFALDALEILSKAADTSRLLWPLAGDSGMLLGVALKAARRRDDSVESMRALRQTIDRHSGATVFAIAMERQELIMREDAGSHERLAIRAVDTARMPREYYRSIKRVFEYLTNHGGLAQARALLPEFRRAYGVMAPTLTPVGHAAFLRDVGQFYARVNESQEALRVLEKAYAYARSKGLHGQVRQLSQLIASIRKQGPELVIQTFEFDLRPT